MREGSSFEIMVMLSQLPWPDYRNAWRRLPAAGERTRWGLMRGVDVGVIRLLDLLDSEMADAERQHERIDLLGLREEFRYFLKRRPAVGIRVWLYGNAGQHAAAPVAVWLLGRCCSSPATLQAGGLIDQVSPASLTLQVAQLINEEAPVTFGRHLAKTLRRLQAWHDLQRLAVSFPQDDTIQRYAKRLTRHSFDERLARFSQHVDHSLAPQAANVSRMPLWLSTEFWFGQPARESSLFRAILWRIHRLVHSR